MPNIFRKSDERKKWRDIKAKHAKAVKAKKLDFNEGLGKALDKYITWQMKDYKTDEQKSAIVIETTKQAQVVKKIVDSYLLLIHGMGDPAEKALRDELNAIRQDASFYDFVK